MRRRQRPSSPAAPRAVLVVGAWLVAAAAAIADSETPFVPLVFYSKDSGHCVRVEPGAESRSLLTLGKATAPPKAPERSASNSETRTYADEAPATPGALPNGYVVVWKAPLSFRPAVVLVADGGEAVFCVNRLDNWRCLGPDARPIAVRLGPDGAIQAGVPLTPFAQGGSFRRSAGGHVDWLRAAWLDERSGRLWFVSRPAVTGSSYAWSTAIRDDLQPTSRSLQEVGDAIESMDPWAQRDALWALLCAANTAPKRAVGAALRGATDPACRMLAACHLLLADDRSAEQDFTAGIGRVGGDLAKATKAKRWARAEELDLLLSPCLPRVAELLPNDGLERLLNLAREQRGSPSLLWPVTRFGSKACSRLASVLGDPKEEAFMATFAAEALGRIREQPEVSVPALTRALDDARVDSLHSVRCIAAAALAKFGSDAAAALPKLRALDASSPENERKYYREAIREITRRDDKH